jgi:hypothetical protein
MHPMVIDDKKLAALRKFAEEHPIPADEVRRIYERKAPPAGEREGYDLDIDFGYRVVCSIEECPLKDGKGTVWLRRMSMSTGRPGKYPNPVGIEEIAGKLGFPPIRQCQFGMEGNDTIVVNVECERPKGG